VTTTDFDATDFDAIISSSRASVAKVGRRGCCRSWRLKAVILEGRPAGYPA
jgi:hypothetical protein